MNAAAFRARWQATQVRHRHYQPPFWRNPDGIWICPCCNPTPPWRKAFARARQWWRGTMKP